MKWWADNSELHGIKEAEIPDILMFGGIIANEDAELELCKAVEAIKERYTNHARAPIKWNVRDLKDFYEKQKRDDLYRKLIESVRDWRMEIFQVIARVECTLIVACIECYSKKRDVLKQKKADLVRYIFSNGLMRFGLHVRETAPSYAQVVLDWPDKSDSKPFDEEYACAYSSGESLDKKGRGTVAVILKTSFFLRHP